MSFLGKFSYYRDFNLLFSVLLDIFTVFFVPLKYRLKLAEKSMIKKPSCSKEKLFKYLNFCFFALKKIGIEPSCYTGSIIICRAFRSRGIEAKVVFGCMWEGGNLKGHCWVELEEPADSKTFLPVFYYPFDNLRI